MAHFGPDCQDSLPNTRRRQALGSVRSIKHFQASWKWFFNPKQRLKDAVTQRYKFFFFSRKKCAFVHGCCLVTLPKEHVFILNNTLDHCSVYKATKHIY